MILALARLDGLGESAVPRPEVMPTTTDAIFLKRSCTGLRQHYLMPKREFSSGSLPTTDRSASPHVASFRLSCMVLANADSDSELGLMPFWMAARMVFKVDIRSSNVLATCEATFACGL